MMLALTFATPLLLLGLLATLIPLALHLLARAHSQEVFFPTLRFLRLSMEKTARRRRIQHLLLMLVRMLMLLLLVLAVAEPITDALGGWMSGGRYAAVVIIDNSMSMGARAPGGTRLDRARTEAEALLGGDNKPAMAALLTTNGGFLSRELSGQMDSLREHINKTPQGYGRAAISQRLTTALAMLEEESIPQKCIYLFSDLQRISFTDVIQLKALASAENVHLLVINMGGRTVENVGISNVEIAGKRIVDQLIEFTATLVNSSPTGKVVDVLLRVDGVVVARRLGQSLSANGKEGSSATVRFYHAFPKAGPATGEVVIKQAIDQTDDLVADNVRRFSLDVGGRVGALVVRGSAGGSNMATSPDMMLRLALSPYADDSHPWSITARTVEADQFNDESLKGIDAAFFCGVRSFTAKQAGSIREFAAAGGTVVFFVGPDIDPDNYNLRFVQEIQAEGGLLPGRLDKAVGEVGPGAGARSVSMVDRKHPYFAGLYDGMRDYLSVIVQRYYRLKASARPGRVLMELENGDPLLVVKSFGRGRVVFCATTASRRWSNLPLTGLFLPMVARMSLLSRQDLGRDDNFMVGAHVAIRPDVPRGAATVGVDVFPPAMDDGPGEVISLTLKKTSEGHLATFSQTAVPGIYRWKLTGGGEKGTDAGSFAVNPNGAESTLDAYAPRTFEQAMANNNIPRVYVSENIAGVHEAAAADAVGTNLWDTLIALAILLLVAEAIVANRFRSGGSSVPAHLNPRIAA